MNICLFGTYSHNYARNTSIRDRLKSIGVKVVEAHVEVPLTQMELSKDLNLINRMINKFISSVKLLKYVGYVRNSDVVVVLHPGHLDLPLAWILTRLFDKRLIFDTHISFYDTMLIGRNLISPESLAGKLVRWIESRLLKLSDLLLVDTIDMKQFIADTFGIDHNKIFVVPIGTNTSLYKPTNNKLAGKLTDVLFYGMYNPFHGAMYIIKAAHKLKQHQNIHFTLIGDGPQKRELESYINHHRLKNITLQGFMPERKLVCRIKQADIVLGTFSNNPVVTRVIPNKIFGAVASRKPLITADMPVLQEYFSHEKNIYFVKPESPVSLAKAIITLAKDKDLQGKIAVGGYEIYGKNFTPVKIAQALMKGVMHEK